MNETLVLPWHQELWRRMMTLTGQGRLGHAWLLRGPEGVGKNHFARLLAWRWLCTKAQGEETACGQCRGCALLQAGTHPDLFQVSPQSSQWIAVDQIRGLVEFLSLHGQENDRRVIVISPAEVMNANAANSLLKLLEEPPSGVIFLLVAHGWHRLPATIRSRCQPLVFSIPDPDRVQPWLQDQCGDIPAEVLLRQAYGAPLRALAGADPQYQQQRREVFTQFIQVLRDASQDSEVAAAWSQSDPQRLLAWLQSWAMDVVRLRHRIGDIVNDDFREALQEIAGRLHLLKVFQILDSVHERRRWLQQPLNQQLMWEDLFILWRRPGPA